MLHEPGIPCSAAEGSMHAPLFSAMMPASPDVVSVCGLKLPFLALSLLLEDLFFFFFAFCILHFALCQVNSLCKRTLSTLYSEFQGKFWLSTESQPEHVFFVNNSGPRAHRCCAECPACRDGLEVAVSASLNFKSVFCLRDFFDISNSERIP